ncbi:MAG: hypothetical protein WKG00_01950 [Polyangiaceae bacterium]
MLYELLAGRPPFELRDDDRDAMIGQVLGGVVDPPSTWADVPAALDAVVLRATAVRPEERFADARAFAAALEAVVERWSPRRVGAWVEAMAEESLGARSRRIAELLAEEKTTVRGIPGGAITSTATGAAAPLRIDRRALWALGLVALGGGAVVAIALGAPDTTDSVENPPPAASAESPAAATVAAADPGAAASPAEGASVRSVGSAGVGGQGTPRPPAPSPRAARPELACVPPYRVDAQGIRRWKKGCRE